MSAIDATMEAAVAAAVNDPRFPEVSIIEFDDLDFGSLNLLADVSARVTEDGGRNVVSKKYVKLKKFDTYIWLYKFSL